jgi:hypothetical protein
MLEHVPTSEKRAHAHGSKINNSREARKKSKEDEKRIDARNASD